MASRGAEQQIQRWAASIGLVFVAVFTTVVGDRSAATWVVAGFLLVVAGVLSPWLFPRSLTDSEGRKAAERQQVPLIYWRPGCLYCLRMRIFLGRAGNAAVWIDIWDDPAAAKRVRDSTGGDETVPTVFIADAPRVNPHPRWVRAQLAGS